MKATKVVSGVVFNYLSTGFVTVTGFAYTAFAVHRLSHSRFGILALVTSIIAYTALLDFGIGLTVMKMVAERASRDEHDEITTIVGNAVKTFTVIGLLAFAVLLAIEPFVGALFHVGGADLHRFHLALGVAAFGVGICFPSAIYTALHQAYGDYRYLSILGICMQAIQVGVGMGLLVAGFGIVALASLGSALGVLNYLLKVRHAHRAFGVAVRRGRFSWSVARGMLTTSSWVFLMNVATYLIFQTDLMVAGAVLGTAAVAAYQVALGPASTLQRAGDQFNSVALTTASSLKSSGAVGDLRRLLLESTRMVAAVAMPGIVVFAIWGHQLLRLWVGRSFSGSYSTLVALALGYLFAALTGTASNVIFALDRYRTLAFLSVGESAVNVVLSVLLARHIGILGVALGTTIPLVTMALATYIPLACRMTGVPYLRLARRMTLPVAVNGLAYLGLRLTATGASFPNLPVLVLACAAVWTVCFGATVLLDPVERPTYLGMARQLVVRARS